MDLLTKKYGKLKKSLVQEINFFKKNAEKLDKNQSSMNYYESEFKIPTHKNK